MVAFISIHSFAPAALDVAPAVPVVPVAPAALPLPCCRQPVTVIVRLLLELPAV